MNEPSPEERKVLDAIRAEWGPSHRPLPPSAESVRARVAEKPWLAQNAFPRASSHGGRFVGAFALAVGACVVGLATLRAERRPSTTGEHGASLQASVMSPSPSAMTAAAETSNREGTESVTATARPREPAMGASVRVGDLPDAPAPPPSSSGTSALAATPRLGTSRDEPTDAGANTPRVSSTADADSLAEEVALIRTAQSDWRAGAPERVLAGLDVHTARFPSGVLRSERMTLQVLALCARGEPGDVGAARAVKAELERVSPGSSHLQRLANSCAR